MTRYVIDAATLLYLVENHVQISSTHQLVAPNLIRSEALTLLLQSVQREELSERMALRHLDSIAEIKMRLLGDRVSRRTAWNIAREQCWQTTHLAEYLAVTQLQADAFVTLDPALATMVAHIVPTASVDALVTA
jgi:predicted nucleic acid-binding protein